MPGVAAELLPGAVRPNQRETKEPERPPADLGEAARHQPSRPTSSANKVGSLSLSIPHFDGLPPVLVGGKMKGHFTRLQTVQTLKVLFSLGGNDS